MNIVNYKQILRRNYRESAAAYSRFNAYFNLLSSNYRISPSEFLGQSTMALFDATIAHLIKTMEKDNAGRSKTFWTIYDYKKNRIDEIINECEIKISFLKKMEKKLKIIRNKTHFHLDEKGITNSKFVWQEADLKIDELKKLIDILIKIYSTLYKEDFCTLQPFILYDGDDVATCVKRIKT